MGWTTGRRSGTGIGVRMPTLLLFLGGEEAMALIVPCGRHSRQRRLCSG